MTASSDQATMYLRLLRTWWWLPLLFGLVSFLVTYSVTRLFVRPLYGATITLQVVTSGNTPQSSANDANSDATLLMTAPVLRQASVHLGTWGRLDLKALFGTTCQADGADRFVTCQTRSVVPRAASGSLNHLAKVFIKINRGLQDAQFRPSLDSLALQEKQLAKEIPVLQEQASALEGSIQDVAEQYRLTALQSQISQDQNSLSQLTIQESALRTQMLQEEGSVRIVNPAVPNGQPISPHPVRYALLGLIVGLGVAFGLIVLFEAFDDRFRSVDEIATLTGVTVLSSIRRFDRSSADLVRIVQARPRSAFAEAFRVARANLQFATSDNPPRVLMVTSAGEGEGKTVCAANLAVAIAISGRRVLLVDADLHRAGLSHALGYPDAIGLADALTDPSGDIPSHATEIPTLRVLPAGSLSANRSELMGTSQMQRCLALAASRFDTVILDTPPILSVADTRELAALVDAVILVVAPEETSRSVVRTARGALEATGTRLLGVVANKVTMRSDAHVYDSGTHDAPAQNVKPAGGLEARHAVPGRE